MDSKIEQEKSQPKDFGDPITPFSDAYPDPAGKITAKDQLSTIGTLTFIASPNIGSVNTEKFFKNPLRIWAELELSTENTEDALKALAEQMAVNVDVRNNNTVTMKGRAEGTKIVFDKVHTSDETPDKPAVDNPLIEDKNRLPAITFTFEEIVE